jgi:hypothetical protein
MHTLHKFWLAIGDLFEGRIIVGNLFNSSPWNVTDGEWEITVPEMEVAQNCVKWQALVIAMLTLGSVTKELFA